LSVLVKIYLTPSKNNKGCPRNSLRSLRGSFEEEYYKHIFFDDL